MASQAFRNAALALAAASTLAACVQLLGDDFEVGDNGAGGNGVGGDGGKMAGPGGGGQGGQGGAGGAQPLPSLSCSWEMPEHIEVDRAVSPAGIDNDVFTMVRRNNQTVRLVALREGASADAGVMYTFGMGTNVESAAFSASSVQQLERIDNEGVGVLITRGSGTAIELALRVTPDSSPAGNSGDLYTIASGATFVGGVSNTDLNARFVVIGGTLTQPVIDVVAWWRTPASDYRIAYARYNGTPVNLTLLTTAAFPNRRDVTVAALTHAGGVTHAWIGEDSNLGLRYAGLTPATAQGVPLVQVGDATSGLFRHLNNGDDTRFFGYREGDKNSLTILTARVPNTGLATFNPDDMAVAGNYAGSSELPVVNGSPSWNGGLFTWFGDGKVNADSSPITMGYWFLGEDGKSRGFGQLPIDAPLPAGETRLGSSFGTTSARNNDFDQQGGTLDVSWLERHQNTAGANIDVLLHNRAICAPL